MTHIAEGKREISRSDSVQFETSEASREAVRICPHKDVNFCYKYCDRDINVHRNDKEGKRKERRNDLKKKRLKQKPNKEEKKEEEEILSMMSHWHYILPIPMTCLKKIASDNEKNARRK
jgi:hypothetical protein